MRYGRGDGGAGGAALEKRVLERGIGNVRILREDAETVSLERQSFDAALLCMVLHEIDRKETVLALVRDALRPGGRLAVVEFLPGSFWGPPPGHRVPPAILQELLEASGFRVDCSFHLNGHRYCTLAVRDDDFAVDLATP